MDEDRVKALAEAKSFLERRLKELESEAKAIRTLLLLVDQALGRESFVTAAELRRGKGEVAEEKPLSEFSITSRSGELIAKMIVYRSRIVVRPHVELHTDTPPFRSFLIARTLEGYRKKDLRRVEEGEITGNEALDYRVEEDERGILKELVIENYGDRQRLFELRGAIRWTLNKMYEKEIEGPY